jgi:DNA-binding Lrp family transcriptional regulator
MHTTRPRLKHASRYVLDVLEDYAVDGVCTLSYEHIAERCGYSERTVKEAIRKMVDMQVISVTKRLGERRNSYVLRGAAYVAA